MIGVKKFDQAPAIRHCHIVGPCGYENLISNLYVNTNFLIFSARPMACWRCPKHATPLNVRPQFNPAYVLRASVQVRWCRVWQCYTQRRTWPWLAHSDLHRDLIANSSVDVERIALNQVGQSIALLTNCPVVVEVAEDNARWALLLACVCVYWGLEGCYPQ